MELVLLILFAGVVAMDTTSGPQLMISEPLISCFVAGVICGVPGIGLSLGLFFQLLWLNYKPLGTGMFIDSKMGAFIAASSYFLAFDAFSVDPQVSRALMYPAMGIAFVGGTVGNRMREWVRDVNGRRSDELLAVVRSGQAFSLMRWHAMGIGTSYSRGVVMAVVLIPLGTMACGGLAIMPPDIFATLASTTPLLWATVLASAFVTFWVKGFRRYLFAGLFGGFVWILLNLVFVV